MTFRTKQLLAGGVALALAAGMFTAVALGGHARGYETGFNEARDIFMVKVERELPRHEWIGAPDLEPVAQDLTPVDVALDFYPRYPRQVNPDHPYHGAQELKFDYSITLALHKETYPSINFSTSVTSDD